MFEVWSVVVALAPQLQPLPQTSSQARFLDYILVNPFDVLEFYWERIQTLYLNFIFFSGLHVQTDFPCQIDGINVRMLSLCKVLHKSVIATLCQHIFPLVCALRIKLTQK